MKIVLKYTFNEDSSFVFFLNWRENLFTLLFTLNKKKQQKWNGAFFFQDFETLLLNSHESLSIFLQMSNCNCFDGFRCDVLVDPSRSWQFIWDFAHFYSDFHQFLPSFTRSLWTFPLFLHYIFILTIFFLLFVTLGVVLNTFMMFKPFGMFTGQISNIKIYFKIKILDEKINIILNFPIHLVFPGFIRGHCLIMLSVNYR